MKLAKIDNFSQNVAFITIVFGIIALTLICVGIATPKWESAYTDTGNGTYALSTTANLFYACLFTNGTYNNCTTRTADLTNYPRYSTKVPWMVDYNLRMQNAASLCVVGAIFLLFAIVMTCIFTRIQLSLWMNLVSPILFFCACIFMLAGMAEGSRYLLYNDYSANLYQSGHALTMFALFLSTLAAGRVHFFRMKEEDFIEKRSKKPVRK